MISRRENDLDILINRAGGGEHRAVARLISLAENNTGARTDILRRLHHRTGNAYCIGITGTPGSGKSSLADKLAKLLRDKDQMVGIIAVDPSSPFSGGAILGDRIRMNDLTLDENIYIRSMGSRGHLGGLSDAVDSAVCIFDACGCDYILIETVGVGQSEVDIAETADTTVVVSVPGLGDDIQMIKSGILEIGDILVVNKADRDGSSELANMLKNMQTLDSRHGSNTWIPPVVMTVASQNEGINELFQAIQDHRGQKNSDGKFHDFRIKHLKSKIKKILQDEIYAIISEKYDLDAELEAEIAGMYERTSNPFDWVGDKIAEIEKRLVSNQENIL